MSASTSLFTPVMTDSNTELIQSKDIKYKIQNLSFKRKLDGNILSHVFLEKSEFCVVAHGVRVSNREQVALISNAFVSPGTKQVSTDNLAMSISFILHDELLRLQEDSGPNYFIPNEVAIQGRSDGELNRYLNDITDRVEVSSDSISDPLVFDKIRSFLKNFASVKPRISAKLFDIILSAFRAEIKATAEDLDNNEKEALASHKLYLELYGFLVHWILSAAEEKASSAQSTRSEKSRYRSHHDDSGYDWSSQKLKCFDLIAGLLELKISRIWTLTPECGTFIGLFTKPAFQIFENPANSKSTSAAVNIKQRAFKVIGLCVKHYGYMHAAQTTIMQNLQYWEHSAEPMAELLQYMLDKQDISQLADEVLREISNKEFKDVSGKEVKDTPNAKTFAAFLTKLSELAPKTILKNLGLLIGQLDSESYTMRMALTDILGLLIIELATNSEESPAQKEQINRFFDILEERMLDPTAYCRSKVLQTYLKILELNAKFPKRRHALGVLALRHLEEKSSIVRKYAIRVFTKLIATHPYSMYGGELDLPEWQRKLDKIKEELESVCTEDEILSAVMQQREQGEQQQQQQQEAPSQVSEDKEKDEEMNDSGNKSQEDNSAIDEREDVEMKDAEEEEKEEENGKEEKDNENQDAIVPETQQESENAPSEETAKPSDTQQPVQKTVVSVEKMQQLKLMKTFHTDAIKFIQQIHTAIPIISQLLSSKVKPEVLEAMDFFVKAYDYKIKPASEGIRKMLHLIWTKDTSDEGKGIKMKLMECYRHLYFDPDVRLSNHENINNITRNLIQLTFNTTLAELTSLEQLLVTIMAEDGLPETVIDKLWAVYGFNKGNIPKAQRRGAIIILGMLAKARVDIVNEKVNLMLRIGLGPLGKSDLTLAKYTCIALQRLGGSKSPEKGRSIEKGIRFPMSHPIFSRLKSVIESPTDSIEWFSLAEQAINTIYLLGEHPDTLCTEIIREMTVKVFGDRARSSTPDGNDLLNESMDIDYDMSMSQQALPYPQNPIHQSAFELSQLLFIVGHVALKQIVHLEIIEAAWKKKKTKKDNGKKTTAIEDELEQVGGTAEDDIGDTITHIRERELLGPGSLLGRFGPLLTEICIRNKLYTDRTLQITATLALAKFMCVSSDFCERNLQLLFTILERAKDSTIRSNLVIALGDMAVSFNTLIDENISFLYNRLADENSIVKKNAVMVLTHLILNGMVKVKGQISEMAKCLEDPDQRIADLAKLFFTELATKDNAIYNNLPDIISNLTNCDPKVEEETFHRIMKFIFGFEFAEKEKLAENVVEKLCQRFVNTDDERIWRDIAYCLSLLPFKSERSFRKLLEGLPAYQDKLHEEAVYNSFKEIISKGRQHLRHNQKGGGKPELKSIIDELEQKIQKFGGEKEKDTEEDATDHQAAPATSSSSSNNDNSSSSKAATRKKRGASRPTKKAAEPRTARRVAQKRKRRIIESEDEESEEEEEDISMSEGEDEQEEQGGDNNDGEENEDDDDDDSDVDADE